MDKGTPEPGSIRVAILGGGAIGLGMAAAITEAGGWVDLVDPDAAVRGSCARKGGGAIPGHAGCRPFVQLRGGKRCPDSVLPPASMAFIPGLRW